MVTEQLFTQLEQMRLWGFKAALKEQLDGNADNELPFDERLAFLVDREFTERQARRLTQRLRTAALREQACIEDIDYRTPRGLDKSQIRRLSECLWIRDHRHILLTGPTGVGKTYLSCALAQMACRKGYTALYRRVSRLLEELTLSRADGSYPRLLSKLAKIDLLILDDWGLLPPSDAQSRDILEVLEDRYGRRSVIISSQLPVDAWYKTLGEPTVADAILDRLVHNAHRLALTGESMRKTKGQLTTQGGSAE